MGTEGSRTYRAAGALAIVALLAGAVPAFGGSAQTTSDAPPAALPDLVRACDRTPAGAAALERFRAGRTPEASPLDELLALAGREPDVVAHQLDLARCFYMDNRTAEAMTALTRAVELLRLDSVGEGGQPSPRPVPNLPVAGRDVPRPTKVVDATPAYSPRAAGVGIAGVVVVDAMINRSGQVVEPRVVGSIPELDADALRAVRQWRYEPVRRDGKPIDVGITLLVKFGSQRGVLFTDALEAARYFSLRGAFDDAGVWLGNAQTLLDREVRARSGAVRVSAGVPEPRKTFHVNPSYPALARAARISGLVILEIVVSPDGIVSNSKVLRSIPMLDQAAVDAVSKWRYTPARLNGEAIPVVMTVTVNFSLN